MSITTWEEAARDAAAVVRRITYGPWSSTEAVLVEIEGDLDDLRDGNPHREWLWSWIAEEAFHGLAETRGWTSDHDYVSADVDVELGLIVETIIRKQHDYGHQNILWGGVDGVIIRCHDKVARIRNLRARGAMPDAEGRADGALHEPLIDSWTDIIGYALIGIMLERGTFELPLAADIGPVDGGPIPALEDEMWQGAIDDLVAALNPTPEEVLFDDDEEDAIRDLIREEVRSELLPDGDIAAEIRRQIREYDDALKVKTFAVGPFGSWGRYAHG